MCVEGSVSDGAKVTAALYEMCAEEDETRRHGDAETRRHGEEGTRGRGDTGTRRKRDAAICTASCQLAITLNTIATGRKLAPYGTNPRVSVSLLSVSLLSASVLHGLIAVPQRPQNLVIAA